jgi:hypothetical protein
MTEERRYQDDEVAKIFETAASPAPTRRGVPARGRSAADEGLTLAELQAIGREVGVPPDRIADAAAQLDRRGLPAPRRTDLGMPVGVARSGELPRAPTDREWALLVGELRETFSARGRERSLGELREWSNGNLHAAVEPTESGWRIRLGTIKGDGLALNRFGAFGIIFAVVMFVAQMLIPNFGDDMYLPLLFSSMGFFALATNAVRLPRWASQREDQMEYIVARAQTLLAEPARPEPPTNAALPPTEPFPPPADPERPER